MSNTLSGLTPAQTFQGLIKVGNNTNVDGTAKVLSDGAGNDLPMEVSTTGVNFTGTLTQNGQPLTTPPSGVSGAIQFSNGSAFSSDASNLFWDDTNNRLGVGTNAPTKQLQVSNSTVNAVMYAEVGINSGVYFGNLNNGETFITNNGLFHTAFTRSGNIGVGTGSFSNPSVSARLHVKGSGSTSATTSLLVQNSSGTEAFRVYDDRTAVFSTSVTANRFIGQIVEANYINTVGNGYSALQTNPSNGNVRFYQSVSIGTTSDPISRLQVVGSGSTSATTSLLVQNSSGTAALTVKDDLSVLISSSGIFGFGDTTNYAKKSQAIDGVEISGYGGVGLGAFGGINTFVVRAGSASLGVTTANASAIFDVVSTTKGLLPPRMTTTQKNGISSPAAGLVVYDSTTNKLCCYNGTSWNDLF